MQKRLYSLQEVKETTRREHRLPWMPNEKEFEDERHHGGMMTRLWTGQEHLLLYIAELEERIRKLEENHGNR